MHMNRRSFLGLAACAPLLVSACASGADAQGKKDAMQQKSFFCFDTACSVGGLVSSEQLDELVGLCEHFESTLSRTIETSDVSRINAAGGEPVEVEDATAELIGLALDYSRASGGLFDITIGAVTRLWDFHEQLVPAPEDIAEALGHVGYERVQMDGTKVQLSDPLAAIDLGGIAKGYVADVLCDRLASWGVTSGYVNLGGNVKVIGTKPDGSSWAIGVREPDPDASDASSVARVLLEGGSVVTSGLYERQFERDGQRYWHILDPRTGYPVESDLVSATIVSERSIDGDGFTKPLFMMGSQQALAWAEEHPQLKLLLVDQTGERMMYPEGSFELL